MSSRADIRRAMRQARCGRCGRKPRDMPDFAQWNHSYVNGRLVEVICADCQTPDEAEEAVHNAASGKSDGMTKAFDCRMMTADELRAYIQTVPDDGERLVPNESFCDFGPGFVGFPMMTNRNEPTLLAIWFPTDIDLLIEDGPEASDGSAIQRLAMIGDEDSLAVTSETSAFMEAPMSDWMGWDRVIVPTTGQEQAEQIMKTFRGLLERYTATHGEDPE